ATTVQQCEVKNASSCQRVTVRLPSGDTCTLLPGDTACTHVCRHASTLSDYGAGTVAVEWTLEEQLEHAEWHTLLMSLVPVLVATSQVTQVATQVATQSAGLGSCLLGITAARYTASCEKYAIYDVKTRAVKSLRDRLFTNGPEAELVGVAWPNWLKDQFISDSFIEQVKQEARNQVDSAVASAVARINAEAVSQLTKEMWKNSPNEPPTWDIAFRQLSLYKNWARRRNALAWLDPQLQDARSEFVSARKSVEAKKKKKQETALLEASEI
ncbi:MAG: hypothetical protein MHM6MM_008621, partial [Cercozoa sp. M6MM]